MRRMVKTTILSLFCAIAVISASAQGVNDVRINEVLINNVNNSTDSFGVHAPWMELFNNGYEQVNVNGCFVGVTYADGTEKRFPIPKNDNATQLGPLSYLVLYFSNPSEPNMSRTNFHTGLSLENATKITLYQASGKDVIDTFDLSFDALPDVTYGHVSTQTGVVALENASMASSNEVISVTPRHELFRQRDPKGGMMAFVAMSVVFFALVLIFLVLKMFGKFMIARTTGKKEVETVPSPESAVVDGKDAELAAAIGVALSLYQADSHDQESYIITFDPSFEHSSWSLKSSEMTEGITK